MANQRGCAYAFLDCKAPKEKIKKELSYIRGLVQTPGDLEISLAETDAAQSQISDPRLCKIAREAQRAGIKYVMKAECPNASNCKTAQEAAAVLNQAYQSPLYEDKEPFRGEIAYKHGPNYAFVA